jgi:hypothetical protein
MRTPDAGFGLPPNRDWYGRPDMKNLIIAAVFTVSVYASAGFAQSPLPAAKPEDAGLTKPTLLVVGYAHLDTKWRWEYRVFR